MTGDVWLCNLYPGGNTFPKTNITFLAANFKIITRDNIWSEWQVTCDFATCILVGNIFIDECIASVQVSTFQYSVFSPTFFKRNVINLSIFLQYNMFLLLSCSCMIYRTFHWLWLWFSGQITYFTVIISWKHQHNFW